ncbi:MAG: hypothetical protein ACRD3C_02300 [Vicinamibacterales bacterium]
MPFLRVVRDKRGYETTYLMHWHRDGTRQRSRILYVFRSPGGVRVGRDSLEPDVLRQIEIQHPDIAFDWKAVFANRQVIESAPDPRRLRKRKRVDEEPEESVAPEGAPQGTTAPQRPPIPSALQGASPDEQIAFLSRWYPMIRELVRQRTSDPERLEALTALAERVNPAAWTDADQIAEGLLRAAEALERLSRVFSRRRRRRRPSKPSAGIAPPELPPTGDA